MKISPLVLLLFAMLGCDSGTQPAKTPAEKAPAAKTTGSAQSNSKLTTCPDCGGKVSKLAAACPHCGRPVSGIQTQPQEVVTTAKQAASLSPPAAIAPFDAIQAKRHQQAWADHLGTPVETTNSIGMKFVVIPPGKFTMGSVVFADSEKPTHKVTLTKPFQFGMHEVTQEQFAAVVGTNPSKYKSSDNPVEMVSWNSAVQFCELLSDLPGEKAAGYEYRLPTESEWEYAYRAGSKTDYWFGNDVTRLNDFAFFSDNAEDRTHPVGQKNPNPWGLFDINGNVWEWCQDFYGGYPVGAVTDPPGPPKGTNELDVRVLIPPFSNALRTAQIAVPVDAYKTEIGVIRTPDFAPRTMGLRHAGKYGWIIVNGKKLVSCGNGHVACKACKGLPDHLGYDVTALCKPGEVLQVEHRHRQINPSLGIRVRFHLAGRVYRGGGLETTATGCRSASRGSSSPVRQSESVGFRVLRISAK